MKTFITVIIAIACVIIIVAFARQLVIDMKSSSDVYAEVFNDLKTEFDGLKNFCKKLAKKFFYSK